MQQFYHNTYRYSLSSKNVKILKIILKTNKFFNFKDHDADGRLPGERFDADKQCVLKYGRGSFHAGNFLLDY